MPHSVRISNEPIAIVGSACRFAGDASNPSKLWELLREPKDIRREIPESRFNVDGYYHPNYAHHGHANVKHSYLLNEDPALFDAGFFGINPIEGSAMDPQQRLLLETIYESIESAGMTIEGLQGSDTAVFAGVMIGDYEAMLLRDVDSAPTYCAVGTSRAILSNRVSYFFDWHGASVTSDTACSSSLVAVHQAVQALRSGDSRMAVACGSNVILGPESYIMESKVKMLSPNGTSRMWDEEADGYARGDGVATVLLKTLSAAVEDGDDIECIIRETGLNQDGTTTGLTMPSATAQRDLILRTYTKAGLNLSVAADRPQYFEAHGTGTPAGDPVEAEAISTAFFGGAEPFKPKADDPPLFVGSIKTVLGHTEGTAGIAALLKGMLAIEHSCVPPNLLFDNLSPDVAPFYQNLEIVKTARPWPVIAKNQPRRASVNCFGFGGTNAHVILESYVGKQPAPNGVVNGNTNGHLDAADALFTPFVFSAASEQSLRANISAYAEHLEAHPETNLQDLAHTLRSRRSLLPSRISFTATDTDQLKSKILTSLEGQESGLGVRTLTRSGANAASKGRILGVFTGQGAQYAGMAAELITRSPLARRIIRRLESHLAQLPEQDRPTWSLEAEILADASSSRMAESAISQPLNTAVQIMLFDLFRTADVHFDAVIGHSGGEVATAYAAGFLSARDALCVAYYRGINCRFAASPNGNGEVKGAMLAVGTSAEDANELCEDDEFKGRIALAAVNSPTSVTISGDEDAIEELAVIMEEEKKFHRRLKVDNAYHSRHMLPAAGPYLEGIRRAGVKARKPPASSKSHPCSWYSSVFDGRKVDLSVDKIGDEYWVENMVRPVLFCQALTAALSSGIVFDAILEIGPHPSLKSPSSQTIQHVLKKPIPYQGALTRKTDAVEAFSTSLGFLWSHLDKTSVDLDSCQAAMMSGGVADSGITNGFNPKKHRGQFRLVKGLPSYKWNHDTRYWHESRRSRQMRLRAQAFHPLLGDATPECGPHILRWKNILKVSELQWLEGHSVQGQVVFPAAGYVSTALEAAQVLAGGQSICLIELGDFTIAQAVTFGGNDAGVEVLIELSQISRQSAQIDAKFTYSAALGGDKTDFSLAAEGNLRLLVGEPSSSLLPRRQPAPPHMMPVESFRMYNYMESLEYNFTGAFLSLSTLSRKLGIARCEAKRASTLDSDQLLMHPVDLDAAFQSINLAYSYPGDDQLRALHLPTKIVTIRVNPAVIAEQNEQVGHGGTLDVDSVCNPEDRSNPGSGFSGNVNVYFPGFAHAAVQLDQVIFRPVGASADERDDRNIFAKMAYVPNKPDGISAAHDIPVTEYETNLMYALSRLVNFFVRKFDRDVPADSPHRTESPLCHYLNYARHVAGLLERDENKFAKHEWINDTFEDVMNDIETKGVANNVDVRIMLLVGETMPHVFAGETNMLEHFRTSGLLDEYYAHGFGTGQSSQWLGNAVKQITDVHPHLRLLEIGAGTGGATQYILPAAGQDFDSYTFTDVSSSFFEKAAETFAPWADRMTFQVCDAEQDPTEQGFTAGSYDAVVACQVLHATETLEVTLRNLRRLLRPGGYLLIGEGSSEGMAQLGAGFIFGTLPGWWRGVHEGRTLSPLASTTEWDALLRKTGFSGIDTMSPPRLFETFGAILMLSQAVNPSVELIRAPLSTPAHAAKLKDLIIIGGQEPRVAQLVKELRKIFRVLCDEMYVYKTVDELEDDHVMTNGVTIINLADLDQPVFEDMDAARWFKVRRLFEGEKALLWLTKGRLEDEPYCNMPVGFGRSAAHEEEGLRLQFLDVRDADQIDARTIAAHLVRLINKQLDHEDILYNMEPEIVIDALGRELVPRLGHIPAANNRLNSTRRHITHPVDVNRSPVELQCDATGYFIRELSRYETSENSKGSGRGGIELHLTHAVSSAIKTTVGHRFLVLGVDSSGVQHLGLVTSLTSVLTVSEESAVPFPSEGLSSEAILTSAAAHLVAMAIVDPIFAGQRLVVHNATEIVAQAIATQASAKGARLIFTTDSEDTASIPSSWIQLPRYTRQSDLAQVIPADTSCFVGFSTHNSANEVAIISTLSAHCRLENNKTLFADHVFDSGVRSQAVLKQSLQRASELIQSDEVMPVKTEVIGLADVVGNKPVQVPLTIVDFTNKDFLPARVNRFDTKQLFKPDKTYWLVGLSGALGISLCDWMIERGMRNLAITSRNPKIDPAWIENHGRNGVVIKTLACDVTDEKALRALHQTIIETMPPIAGALNGAMVLRDVTVANMSYEQAFEVIRPKVLGSIYLDRIFYDIDLDFFILLSSASCVIGNVGQANYSAANMGMCGVAANRRKRGLRSSVANVGAIIGIGYITESSHQLDLTVANQHLIHLNEEDFHQIFAEVMDAGYLDSPNGPEISTGIRQVATDEDNMPVWFSDPKFGRLMVTSAADDGKKERASDTSIFESLEACKTEADVLQVVKEAFSAQLRKTLQTSTGSDELMDMRSSDLGLDSLISVDIRSWFLKNFQVSIPVLKIMAGDAQMIGLVETAAKGVPAALIPQVPQVDIRQANGSADTDKAAAATNGTNGEIGHAQQVAEGESVDIDWEAELVLPEYNYTPEAKPPNPSPEVVVLTGASGLLGHHLLNTLIEQPSIRKIICLAVRQLPARLEAGELPAPSDRIIYYEGDLAVPRLGLSEEEESAIFNEVDAVIHNGADTSHLKSYAALRDTNILSTRQLLQLCLKRLVPFHYISSAGMALFTGRDPFPSISGIVPGRTPADGQHGYMTGKWVIESLLERVNAAYGLRVWIHRPSTIIREGGDAIGTKADFDWVNTLVDFCHRTQAVPRVEHNKGSFDLVRVQTVCEDVVGELVRNSPYLPSGMTFLNNVGDRVIPMARMSELARDKGGKNDLYKVLPWSEWLPKAKKAGLHPAVAALVEVFDEPGAPTYPMLSRART